MDVTLTEDVDPEPIKVPEEAVEQKAAPAEPAGPPPPPRIDTRETMAEAFDEMRARIGAFPVVEQRAMLFELLGRFKDLMWELIVL